MKITKAEAVLIEARERLHELAAVQTEAREEELKIREFFAKKYAEKEDGATTLTVGSTKFTVTTKINRSISQAEADRLVKEHGDLSLEVLRWKPELRVGELKKHPELEEYIVSKAGPATVCFK